MLTIKSPGKPHAILHFSIHWETFLSPHVLLSNMNIANMDSNLLFFCLQKIVGLAVTALMLSKTESLMPAYHTARQYLLNFEDTAAYVAVHDPTKEQFNAWWAYNPKQDLVLGNILGGWLLFNKRRQERLGQKSSFAVSNASP